MLLYVETWDSRIKKRFQPGHWSQHSDKLQESVINQTFWAEAELDVEVPKHPNYSSPV
jgi:hypothetical protein